MAANERLICAKSHLKDSGRAVRFVVERDGLTRPAFVVSFAGALHAYVNCCPHRGTELDWQPGEVFDQSGLYLVCATHGALFEPKSGLCVGGPCQGSTLTGIVVDEVDGGVFLRAGRLVSSAARTEIIAAKPLL